MSETGKDCAWVRNFVWFCSSHTEGQSHPTWY